MKHRIFIVIASLLLVSLAVSQCKKKKILANPVDRLPKETQVGANTFGCLIDGKVFIPKGSPFSGPRLQCAYQYLESGSSKGYYFQLSASDKSNSSDVTSIGVYTNSLEVSIMDFLLGTDEPGKSYGFYHRINLSGINMNLYTNNNLPGQLIITKFDEINQIVSGTFWFSVVVSPGDTINITNGRFDMQFTK